jgi:hypothetical protein
VCSDAGILQKQSDSFFEKMSGWKFFFHVRQCLELRDGASLLGLFSLRWHQIPACRFCVLPRAGGLHVEKAIK